MIALGERQDLLEAYLLDLAGWAGIEAAVRALRRDLIAALPAGPRLPPARSRPPRLAARPSSARSSSLFADDDAPVRLSEHGVLVPFKSISGLFGVRP